MYEGMINFAITAQKVYRLQGELHRTHMRGKGDVRDRLLKLFDIINQLADLGSPVNYLQMMDRMMRSFQHSRALMNFEKFNSALI